MTRHSDHHRRLAFAALLVTVAVSAGSAAVAQDECMGFVEETIVAGGTSGVEAIQIADLDADGDSDLLSASFGDDSLFWYENDGAQPPSFTPRRITANLPSASAVFAADVDGDQDLDVIGASATTSSVVWYESNGGSPPIFTTRTITSSLANPQSVFAADVDGDGDIDVLAASFNADTIVWYENMGGRTPEFTSHVVSSSADGASAVFAIDLDGDQDTDILSASRLDNKIAWYENDGAADPTFTQRVISTSAMGARWVHVDDLDNDGDPDVLSASHADDKIAWYENKPGAAMDDPPVFEERDPISTTAKSATFVSSGDINGDGAVDVLSASYADDKIAWYESDGATPPAFTERIISTAAIHADAVLAADLDDDNDVDVYSASSVPGFPTQLDKLAWYENDGAGALEERRITRSADGAADVFAADLDLDGDVDVATAGRTNRISWYESDGNVPPAFTEQVVSVDAAGAVSVLAIDLDRDGDTDLLSASEDDDKIAWYESDGAADPTFVERPVSTTAVGAREVFAIDLDGDGDIDVLSASAGDDKIAWYENLGSNSLSFEERMISVEAVGARSVWAADLDGDTDIDVLSASAGDNKIAWYANDGASPPSFTENALSAIQLGANGIIATDVDGDGDTDIVSIAAGQATLAWWENDGATDPTFTIRLITTTADDPTSVIATDFDEDGDEDLVLNAIGDSAVVIFQNDGATPPAWDILFVTDEADLGLSSSIADMDGDNDLDIVTGQRLSISWFAASGETCQNFDANDDGLIDGVELAWVGRAFGLSSADPSTEWWFGVDFNQDGLIDGEDLAIVTSFRVFGSTTTTCRFVCQ